MKTKTNLVRFVILLLVFVNFQTPVVASDDRGDHGGLSQIKDRRGFFKNNNQLDIEVISKAYAEIEKRRNEMFSVLVQQKLNAGALRAEAEQKALKEDEVFGLDLALKYLDELKNMARSSQTFDSNRAHQLAQKVLDLSYTVKNLGQKPAILRVPEWVQGVMHEWKVDLNTPIEREANNLWDPERGKYYSYQELAQLVKEGKDISLLNPPPNSGIWRSPGKISDIKISDFYYGGHGFMYQGLKLFFPKKKVALFKSVRMTQTSPKIMVEFEGTDGQIHNAKLKFGKDLHGDITASSLFLALGYPADVSRYYRDFKVYFKNPSDIETLKKDWLAYFTSMPHFLPSPTVDEVIKEKGRDDKGYYVIFKECVMEAAVEGLNRLGPVDFDQNGIQKWREARAYALLNLWVENADWDPDNSKLILKKNGADYDFIYSVHDLGCVFGGLLCEKIDRFRYEAVSEITKNEIIFDYRSSDNQPMKDEATFSDYKWGARLIAQLTRSQIEEAVAIGQWPQSIQKLLVEKLISRRNDFVKAFGLSNEVLPDGTQIVEIPVNKNLTTEDGVVVNGTLQKGQIEGYGTNYGEYWNSLIWQPLWRALKDQVKFSVNKALCELEKISVDPVWVGLNDGIIGEVLLTACRDIVKNPNPTSEKDIWLVRDILKIGVRGGFGFAIAAEVDLMKQFTMVYGVGTQQEALNGQGTAINFLLPLQIYHDNLPEKYVLIREDFIIPRVRARSDSLAWTLVGAQAADQELILNRTVISNKGNNRIIVYEDTSIQNELALKLYFDLKLARIGFFKYTKTLTGQFNGMGWVLPGKAIQYMQSPYQNIFSDVVRFGDLSQIEKIPGVSSFKVDAENLSASYWALNFLGFYQRSSSDRQDSIKFKKSNVQLQVRKDEYRQRGGYSIFGLTEIDDIRVRGSVSQQTDFSVGIMFLLKDSHTTSEELDNGFLSFLNGVYSDKRLPFSAELNSSNGVWGHTLVRAEFEYYPEAINALVALDEKEFLQHYLKYQDYDKNELFNAWHEWFSPDLSVVRQVGTLSTSGVATNLPWAQENDLDQLAKFIERIRKARALKGTERLGEVMSALKEAIYYDKDGESLDYSLFAAIHSWVVHKVGEHSIYLHREITTPLDVENRFPGGKGLQWEPIGTKRPNDALSIVLLPEDVLDVWQLFDWVK